MRPWKWGVKASNSMPLYIKQDPCHHPASPTDEDTPIAHRYDDSSSIAIDPQGPLSGPNVDLGAQADFLQWVYVLISPIDEEDYWQYIALIPVGETHIPVDVSGAVIPELVSGSSTIEEVNPSAPINRSDVPQDEGELPDVPEPPSEPVINWVSPVMTTAELIAYWTQILDAPGQTFAKIQEARNALISLGLQAGVANNDPPDSELVTDDEDGDMSIYSDLDEKWFGGGLPGGAPGDWTLFDNPLTTPFIDPGNVGPPPGNGNGNGGAPPAGGNGNGCHPGASPVFKKVCGAYKWVTPKRRRRKMLVTQGDLKGLAALAGVLGKGKAFETWIATHS